MSITVTSAVHYNSIYSRQYYCESTHQLELDQAPLLAGRGPVLASLRGEPLLQGGQPAPGAPRVVDEGELDQGEEDEGGAGPHPDVYRLTSWATFHLFCSPLSRLRPLTLIGLLLADFIAIYCLRSKPVCPHDIYLFACAFVRTFVHSDLMSERMILQRINPSGHQQSFASLQTVRV